MYLFHNISPSHHLITSSTLQLWWQLFARLNFKPDYWIYGELKQSISTKTGTQSNGQESLNSALLPIWQHNETVASLDQLWKVLFPPVHTSDWKSALRSTVLLQDMKSKENVMYEGPSNMQSMKHTSKNHWSQLHDSGVHTKDSQNLNTIFFSPDTNFSGLIINNNL